MKYTIGEMSQLLGVTPHMLRYYEKVGIIRPETNNATGYRYYSVVDTRRFNLSRALFSSGISLERCSEILQGMPQPELEALLDEKIAEQKRQIQRTQIAIQYMESVKETYRSLDSQVGQVRIQYFPRFWRLNLSQNEPPLQDPALEGEKNAWLEYLPAVYWVSRIPHDTIRQFSQGPIDYQYGLMCREEDALALGLARTERVEVVPNGDYLVMLHRKTGRTGWMWEDIQAAVEYLKANSMCFFGDAFSHIVASRVENGEIANYHPPAPPEASAGTSR